MIAQGMNRVKKTAELTVPLLLRQGADEFVHFLVRMSSIFRKKFYCPKSMYASCY
jgi:hypothetical protein